jgi:hypothetical protein
MPATNRLEIIDPAVMRPGKKFDSKVRLGFVRLGFVRLGQDGFSLCWGLRHVCHQQAGHY